MVCDEPIKRGPNKGQPARGTHAGYQRHIGVGEPACPECMAGHNESERQRWADGDGPRLTALDYYHRNRERIDESHRQRRLANPEPEQARKRRWLEDHATRLRALTGPCRRRTSRRWTRSPGQTWPRQERKPPMADQLPAYLGHPVPIKETDGYQIVNMLRAERATFIDRDHVEKYLDETELKIAEAEGEPKLAFIEGDEGGEIVDAE